MTVLGQVSIPNTQDKSVEVSINQQIRYEVNGAELKNPEKFMIDQKYGVTEPVLTQSELQSIAAEGARLER